MAFDFNYESVQILCRDLISICDNMKQSVRCFEQDLDKHGEMLDDRITSVSTDVFKRIQDDINGISKYLEEFTERKQDAARDMEEIEQSIAKEVDNIGG